MEITVALILIAALYAILLFFDMFFKSCAHYPYVQFLKGTGFSIHFLQIRWMTTAFNRIFLRWGNHSRFLNAWFTCGLYVTLVLLPISALMLLYALGQNLFQTHGDIDKTLLIEPLIPGINLPTSEIGYYSLSLIISSVVHELGHALAAVKEDVHISNVGVTLLYVLPVAYVNLSSEGLNMLNPWRALKVLCAGIWHNLILSLFAYLLYSVLPFGYSTVFKIDEGVLIKELTSNSPLLGPKGLELNNIITKINLCQVVNERHFYECLAKSYTEKLGYCVDTDTVHNLDESVPLRHTKNGVDCCNEEKSASLCFEYMEKLDGVLEIPQHSCLPARTIIESSKFYCHRDLNCPHGLHCIKPILDNFTSLIKIERVNKPEVIYVGHPSDIAQTVTISSFIPKYKFSKFFIPDVILKFLEYTIIISTGLAIINVIPCAFMDGQHIINRVLQIVLKQQENTRLIATILTLFSTFVLISHCVCTIWQKLF